MVLTKQTQTNLHLSWENNRSIKTVFPFDLIIVLAENFVVNYSLIFHFEKPTDIFYRTSLFSLRSD